MKGFRVALALVGLTSAPALAAGKAEGPLAVLLVYILYAIIAACLVGWSFLVSLLARPRVELASKTLATRPMASFIMGLLCLGWLLLSFVIAEAAKGVGGLLVLVTLSILILCAMVGLPAIFVGLGRRASQYFPKNSSLPKELFVGALVLFAAGGFPWLGQLLLMGLLVWALGGSVLSLFAATPAAINKEPIHIEDNSADEL